MKQTDWVKIYAAMDKRLDLKYEQLPNGEQIGKPRSASAPGKNSSAAANGGAIAAWPLTQDR
jgi:hypothetical protein